MHLAGRIDSQASPLPRQLFQARAFPIPCEEYQSKKFAASEIQNADRPLHKFRSLHIERVDHLSANCKNRQTEKLHFAEVFEFAYAHFSHT